MLPVGFRPFDPSGIGRDHAGKHGHVHRRALSAALDLGIAVSRALLIGNVALMPSPRSTTALVGILHPKREHSEAGPFLHHAAVRLLAVVDKSPEDRSRQSPPARTPPPLRHDPFSPGSTATSVGVDTQSAIIMNCLPAGSDHGVTASAVFNWLPQERDAERSVREAVGTPAPAIRRQALPHASPRGNRGQQQTGRASLEVCAPLFISQLIDQELVSGRTSSQPRYDKWHSSHLPQPLLGCAETAECVGSFSTCPAAAGGASYWKDRRIAGSCPMGESP